MAVVVALLATACVTGGYRGISPDPVVATDVESFDFGNIPPTAPVEHEFTVANKGGKDLNISNVRSTCGCTAAVVGHQLLKPGESTKLKVTFDPRGRSGPQQKPVIISSNDPKSPQKTITITCVVLSEPPPQPAPAAPAPAAPAPAAPAPAAPAPAAR
jgi:hypothetical protein